MQGMNGIYGYISAQGIQNLESYKYSGVDHSFLANLVMKHFWNWLLDNVVPVWIAPNLLTLFGFLCVFIANFLLWTFSSGMGGWAPGWVYVVAAFFIFAYQTLDNLDGKQARKTGTSSALGEVFDHGSDSLTVCMFVMIMGSSFQLGPLLSYLSLVMLTIIFYLNHWEGYFTGTLFLRKYSNPTEAQLSLISLLLLTAWKGSLWWKESLDTILFGTLEHREILFVITVFGFFSTAYDHISTVYSYMSSRGSNFRPAILALIPLIFLHLISTLWILCSPTVLFENSRIFISTIGLLFSYLAIRLIVQNVTKETFKIYYNMLSPLLVITIHSFIGRVAAPLLDDEFVLQVYFLAVLLHIAFLILSVVTEFCWYLNIKNPFIIRQTPPQELV